MEIFSALLALCEGNSPVTGEFPPQRPVTRRFDVSFDMAWIKRWVNNREAGDLRHTRTHYDIILMCARKPVINRQQAKITDLRMRSMKDNFIVKTSGSKYREVRNENTSNIINKFLVRIPNGDAVGINSSHRMGQATGEYNKMLILRLPKRENHRTVFDNARALKGTKYSISKQIPVEVEDRRQFAWADFKQAKADKKAVRFDGTTLGVGSEVVAKYQPVSLPTFGNILLGDGGSSLPYGASDITIEGDHRFRAWAVPVRCQDDVRQCLDQPLHLAELSGTTFVPYAYRYSDGAESYENFHSDGDTNYGLSLFKILRKQSASDIAAFVTHHALGRPLSRRKKRECLASVISGAIMALNF